MAQNAGKKIIFPFPKCGPQNRAANENHIHFSNRDFVRAVHFYLECAERWL